MSIKELDNLINLLEPGCNKETLADVRKALILRLAIYDHSAAPRSDQQNVDMFEAPLANDPRAW